ncbi:MAG: hypothetical protein H6742_11140 [Alphaproteobacteria bacterium]|nr:hypothetical protein [Alphaproteobacteria bacterium]
MTLVLLLLLACPAPPGGGGGVDGDSAGPADGGGDSAAETGSAVRVVDLPVVVTLDGAPVEGAVLAQGGNPARWTTDATGRAVVSIDRDVGGELSLTASHPDARIAAEDVEGEVDDVLRGEGDGAVDLALASFDASDNPAYLFQDPGDPSHRDTTAQCAHCHITIDDDWFGSAHAAAARNPWVHDLYAGAAAARADEAACDAAGGTWRTGRTPGGTGDGERCYVGAGALPDLNVDCGDDVACDTLPAAGLETGDCAACHAPGIDGALADRGLHEAVGLAYDYGVHCDVCHKVASVDTDSSAPGVEGRLGIVRPSEPSSSAVFGDFAPLTFGPYDDVPNPRMGSVARPELFASADLCSGCHEYEQPVRVVGASIDAERWPEGRLPVHSTFSEWRAGPYGDADGHAGAPCQSCHMPADGDVGNSADLGNIQGLEPGVATGWYRAAGAVRRHAWFGPRSDEVDMLGLAARLDVDVSVAQAGLEVHATVQNVGPGHALPTGEPLRHLLLLVEATCDGAPLAAVGGDVVADYGGALDERDAAGDLSVWPGAEVGDRIVVVRRTGTWRSYRGPAPFDGSRFSDEEQGLAEEELVGEARVLAVDGERVTLDRALPSGDVARRLPGDGLPTDGQAARPRAGAPGFSFARVLVDTDGSGMVPHHAAVDVQSDNRLMPRSAWTSRHTFAGCSGEARVDAVLVYRSAPLELAAERGWTLTERVIASAWGTP